ncbi:MAG TPA: Rieske 2Fe-2S domain-containing protein [Methylomirabilota bacterium]|nr:Rieske 2Fe-2S domain-containing protein [Methylomirabilota bacterium]
MKINRREFLVLTAGFAAGCSSMGGNSLLAGKEQIVNVGSASDYSAEGVYSKFRDCGFFIVRKGEKLFALSAICTHKYCKLIAEPDQSFYCKCHGSTFDPSGKVTEGPAKRDLPMFPTVANQNGELLVTIPAT